MTRLIVARRLLIVPLCSSPLIASTDVARRQPILSDSRIERVIEGELWEARGVDGNDIDVDVTQGIATLRGTVDSLISKERAVRIARMTRDILDEVAADAQAALARDPLVTSDIAVTVADGNAMLYGTVASAFERAHAEDDVARIEGITEVRNYLGCPTTGRLTPIATTIGGGAHGVRNELGLGH